MESWTRTEAVPKEDMRVPLESTADLERMDLIVWKARERGLSELTFVVADRISGPWLPAVLAGARRHRSGRAPRIQVALEARIVDDEGRLSLPAPPPGVNRLYVTLDGLPGGVGRTPMELREAFEEGRTSAIEIVSRTVELLRSAVRRNPGVVVSRPFALLSAVGIPEDWVGPTALEMLARDIRNSGASLQVDEWERTPRAEAMRVFVDVGVSTLWGTGTRDTEGVGVYDYVRRLIRRVPGLAESLTERPSGRRGVRAIQG